MSDWLCGRQVGKLDRSCQIGGLAGRLAGWLAGRRTGRLAVWRASNLFASMDGRMVGTMLARWLDVRRAV